MLQCTFIEFQMFIIYFVEQICLQCGKYILHLDVVFNPSSKVLNDKSQLCIQGGYKEWIVLMLLLQLVQQGFICGLRKAEDTHREGQNININIWYMGKKADLGQQQVNSNIKDTGQLILTC